MRTSTMTGIGTVALVAAAGYKDDLAAIYIAVAWGCIMYMLHAIEVKLNRLLDERRITVTQGDISRE